MSEIQNVTVEDSRAMFSCMTKLFIETIQFLNRVIPRGNKRTQPFCEITIKTNEVCFVVPGASKTLYCKANGPAKIVVPFWYLYEIVSNLKGLFTLVLLKDGFMRIDKLTIEAKTFFFNDDSILRSINLPINYGPMDILVLPLKYTPQEIEFNDLSSVIENAQKKLENDINHAYVILKKYGFKKKELDNLIRSRIFGISPETE